MSQIVFSDEALKQAAASVRQSMLDSLPPPSQCEHEFSDTFQTKMTRLLSRDKRLQTVRKTARRAAAFFLAALIGASAWLGVDAEARAVFFPWVREVYEGHIVYRFFGKPAADTLPAYRITWLPEGYKELDVYDSDDLFSALYQKGASITNAFAFQYIFVQEGSLHQLLLFDEENYNYKTVDINGIQADFYESLIPDETSTLIWIDENAGIFFTLNGFLEESVIIHIAESIILASSTK